MLHNIFQSLFLLSLGSSRFFSKVPSLVYKLEMCKERMFSALTHSGVWSLFQAVLMTKYAMNLEHLQPWRGGKLLSALPPVFACSSSLPLDLFYTKLLLCSRAVARGALLGRNAAFLGYQFVKLLLASHCIQKYEFSLF